MVFVQLFIHKSSLNNLEKKKKNSYYYFQDQLQTAQMGLKNYFPYFLQSGIAAFSTALHKNQSINIVQQEKKVVFLVHLSGTAS